MKSYWLINVCGNHGYSVMIHGEIDREEDAIDAAVENELFDAEEDAEYAFAEEMDANSNDVKYFVKHNMVIEV